MAGGPVRTEASARAAVESGRKKYAYGADHKSFGRFILSDQMRDVTVKVAKDIAARARELAHRDSGPGRRRTTHYGDRYEVNRNNGGTMVVDGDPRVMVLVTNDDNVAVYNEFGNARTPRRRTLGRAGAMFGDFKPDTGPL